jgi:hypothetical protein
MYQAIASPDGRWVAGTIGAPPNLQIYVQSLAGSPGRWQISATGGFLPLWTKGGKELLYEGLDGQLMAVDIDTRDAFHAGTPHALFALPSRSFAGDVRNWACDSNGEKFILVAPVRAADPGIIEVVTDFGSLVTRK